MLTMHGYNISYITYRQHELQDLLWQTEVCHQIKAENEISEKTSIYRLAVGLPINSALNYADNETLSQAIKNKTKY